jgi:long-chain fatty acid transport protein
MADVQYTGWSSVQQLQVVRSTGAVLETLPENFRNTWRYSVGANYRYNDNWTFRGGLAYDQSPVNSTDRSPRLPDDNRTWIAVGTQYKFNPNWALDVAYAYIWIDNASINQNGGNAALSRPYQRFVQGQCQHPRRAGDLYVQVTPLAPYRIIAPQALSCGATFSTVR